MNGLTKLSDANNAGGRNAARCTLILTEGDSAKALAEAGLSVVGRDNFGVFPLKGKLLNVREASHDTIMKNQEISNIKKIMGLQSGHNYKDVAGLRYGSLMIMADQVSPQPINTSVITDSSLGLSGSRWLAYQRPSDQLHRPFLPVTPQDTWLPGRICYPHRPGTSLASSLVHTILIMLLRLAKANRALTSSPSPSFWNGTRSTTRMESGP